MYKNVEVVSFQNRHLEDVSVDTFSKITYKKNTKSVTVHITKTLGGRGGIAPTHSRPRH
jgi:hypothetical protein